MLIFFLFIVAGSNGGMWGSYNHGAGAGAGGHYMQQHEGGYGSQSLSYNHYNHGSSIAGPTSEYELHTAASQWSNGHEEKLHGASVVPLPPPPPSPPPLDSELHHILKLEI